MYQQHECSVGPPTRLPPILIGGGLNASPVCSEHGAMLRYENNIWRCESCKGKPSVDLTRILRFIHHELTVMEK